MTEARHLAQFNIARIRYPLDDLRMREFVENVERVNGLAEKIPGFIWRLHDESGHAMNMRVYDDPTILPNLSVWESAEALERFVWARVHKAFYNRKAEWFAPATKPHFVMWPVEEGHRLDLDEAMARLDYLTAHGDSEFAFSWSHLPHIKLWMSQKCG